MNRIRSKNYVEPLGDYFQFDLLAPRSPTVAELQSGETLAMRDRSRALQTELPRLVELGLLEHVGRYEAESMWNLYRVLPALWDVELDG